MGLLNKITSDKTEEPCFSSFCKKHGLIHAGLFCTVDGMYILKKVFGIDAVTIFKSFSSPDFWEGTVTSSDKWVDFNIEDKSINCFYQFFSEEFVKHLTSLHLLKFQFNDETLFFSFAELDNDSSEQKKPFISPEFISDLVFNSNYKLNFTFNHSDIENQIKTKLENYSCTLARFSFADLFLQLSNTYKLVTENLCNVVENSLFEEIIYLFSQSLSEYNISIPNKNFEFKVAIFSKYLLSGSLLHCQFAQLLKPYFHDLIDDSVFIHIVDFTQSPSNIETFLLGV